MRIYQYDISCQEVPDELSLILSISGCPNRCTGCHSKYLWKETVGEVLDQNKLEMILKRYERLITCVCFFGGEWHQEELITFLEIIQSKSLKTCLYTGSENIGQEILDHLTYVKLGPYLKNKGGLNSKETNQRFINVKTQQNLNELFLTTSKTEL